MFEAFVRKEEQRERKARENPDPNTNQTANANQDENQNEDREVVPAGAEVIESFLKNCHALKLLTGRKWGAFDVDREALGAFLSSLVPIPSLPLPRLNSLHPPFPYYLANLILTPLHSHRAHDAPQRNIHPPRVLRAVLAPRGRPAHGGGTARGGARHRGAGGGAAGGMGLGGWGAVSAFLLSLACFSFFPPFCPCV